MQVKHWRLEHAKKASKCDIAWQQEMERERKGMERKCLRKKEKNNKNEAKPKKEHKKMNKCLRSLCLIDDMNKLEQKESQELGLP